MKLCTCADPELNSSQHNKKIKSNLKPLVWTFNIHLYILYDYLTGII